MAAALILLMTGRSGLAADWYVGNTAAGEWIEYQHIWLTTGNYRFTGRVGAAVGGVSLHLEVDGTTVRSGVTVPNTGRADRFDEVHLGSTALAQGYHDLRVVFDTGGASIDWFALKKSDSTATEVSADDVTIDRPPTSGMLVGPVVGYEHQESGIAGGSAYVPSIKDKAGNAYTDAQLTAWYGVPMYRDYDRRTDRYWDVMVDELMASRAQVPLFHCRETTDFTHDLQDRRYQPGGGSYEGRWLKKLAEAVARNPRAMTSLKIGMFWEDGGIATGFNARYGYLPSWGDPAFVDYVMDYWLGPWFDNVPKNLLYQPTPGRPIIRMYTVNPDSVVQDGRLGDFLSGIRSRMRSRYGLDPLLVLNYAADAAAQTQAWGLAQWVTWDGPLFTSYPFGGTYWGTVSSGSRRRIDTVWLNDWNPATNTGTGAGDSPGHDSHQPRIGTDGVPSLWKALKQAQDLGTRLVAEEGFTNISEGNSIFRSCHPEWAFPNQHLGAMREFADPATGSYLLEAEACDRYQKITPGGNHGGSFRRQWYSATNLDVYRPLHNLQPWTAESTGPGNLAQIVAGFYDVWGIDAGGQLWGREITGNPDRWNLIADTMKFTSVSLSHGPGNIYAWGVSGGSVYSCPMPYSSDAWVHGSWTKRTGTVVQVSAGRWDVWGLDASGHVYHRPIDGSGAWVQAGSMALNRIAVEDTFLWGLQGSQIYYASYDPTAPTTLTWIACPNPSNLTQLQVGSEEVWGTNASGQIYRKSASGAGDWELVDGTATALTVGENFVWARSGSAILSRRLEGYATGLAAGAPLVYTPAAGSGRVALNWTPSSGASGYVVKRATSSGGPYVTVSAPTTPGYVDTGLANGTSYFYVVTSLSGGGESAPSAEVSAVPRAVPVAPTSLIATAVSIGKINLTWTDNSADESGFQIERKTGANGAYSVIGTLAANATTFSDITLASDTTYYYRLRAINDGGDSAPSNEAGATTLGGSTIYINFQPAGVAPEPGYLVDGGTVYATRANGLSYGWSVDNSGQARQRGVSSDHRIDTMVPFRAASTWEIAVPNGTYSVKISVGDTSGTYRQTLSVEGVSYWNNVNVGPACANATQTVTVSDGRLTLSNGAAAANDTRIDYIEISPVSVPPVPLGVAVTAGNGQVALSWTGSPFATGYVVKRATTSGGPYATIGSAGSTDYRDTTTINGTIYYYVVAASNSFGSSADSAEVSATPQNQNTTLYEAENAYVTGATVASGTAGYTGTGYVDFINSSGDYVEWTVGAAAAGPVSLEFRYGASSDRPLSLSVNGTIVKSSLSFPNTGGFAVWGSVATTVTLSAGTNTIRLTAIGSSGNNIDSLKVVSAGVQSPPAPRNLAAAAGHAQISLSWEAPSGATSYLVKRSTVPGGPYQQVATVTQPSYTDTGLAAGTYYYVVCAIASGSAPSDSSTEASAMALVPLPATPAGVTISATEARVTLSWPATAGAASYAIARATSSVGPFLAIGSSNNTGYVDAPPADGHTYFYTVTAVNTDGSGDASTPVSATVQLFAPTSLSATAASESQVRLIWSNASSAASANEVEYSAHGANSWASVAALPAGATSYLADGLAASTSHDFRVRATDTHGGASPYVQATALTPAGVGDGIPGSWRLTYFGNGLQTTPESAAGADPDGDGFSNLQEYLAGTVPIDGASVLRIRTVSFQAGDAVVTFDSVSGKSYALERTTALGATPAWSLVQDNISGTGAAVSIVDPGAAGQPARFYRVRLK